MSECNAPERLEMKKKGISVSLLREDELDPEQNLPGQQEKQRSYPHCLRICSLMTLLSYTF
jgi:hypothetical protein